MPKTQIHTIGIVGTGNFAQVLRLLFMRNSHWQIKQSSRKMSIDHKTIFPLEEVLGCDVVFLAIPISSLKEFLTTSVAKIPDSSSPLFCDVSSVKELPEQWMCNLLPVHIDVLATHPLFGPESTNHGSTFTGLSWVITQSRIRNRGKLQELLRFLTTQHIRCIFSSASDHDRRMARTQAVAFLFGKLGQQLQLTHDTLETKGFDFLLQNQAIVASDTDELFWDILHYNQHAQTMVKQVSSQLHTIQEKL